MLGFLLCHAKLMHTYVRPQQLQTISEASYSSQGTLLIAPSSRSSLASLTHNSNSAIDRWLRDEEMLQLLISRRKLYSRALTKIADKPPHFTEQELTERVSLTTIFSNTTPQSEMTELERNLLNQKKKRVAQVAVNAYTRVLMLKVQTVGPSPRQAQQYAAAVLASLEEILVETSSETARLRREKLEATLKEVQINLVKARSKLKNYHLSSHRELVANEADIDHLRHEARKLEIEIHGLTERLSQPLVLTQADPSEGYTKADAEFIQAQIVYLPNSAGAKRAAKASQRENKFRESQQEERLRSYQQSLLTELTSKKRLLSEVESNIVVLKKKLLSNTEAKYRASLQRAEQSWEAEADRLANQIFGARIEERMARSDCSTVLLQPPMPGARNSSVLKTVASRYYLVLILLPLSAMAGLACYLGLNFYYWNQDKSRQVALALDTPVVCLLPPLSEQDRVKWEIFKRGK
ncbi:MAG: hypothetical protein KIS61_10230 [Candidatus Eremiobacteraeota bacterium]|nr:hypothetical protein [Candidatus Eremiobacteraeota bacterium]